jgi:predicted  nucleic acid-binding Zn-ribbon protein
MKPAAAEAKKIKALEALQQSVDEQGRRIDALVNVITELTNKIEALTASSADETEKKAKAKSDK